MRRSTLLIILGYIVLNIFIAPLFGLPNIFGVIWWPIQQIIYYGFLGFWSLVTAAFGYTLGKYFWWIIGLLILSRIPIIGAPIRWLLKLPFRLAWNAVKGRWKSRKLRKSEIRRAFVGRFARLIRNEFWARMDSIRARNNINKKAWTKRRIPPDYLPTILRENIIILYSLSNYLKRLYIWYVKFDQVKNAKRVCETMWGFIGPLYTDPSVLEKEIYACRNGGIVRTPTGTINVGWFDATKRYCDVLNNTSDLLTQYVKDIISGKKGAEDYIGRIQNTRDQLATAIADIKRSHQHLAERGKAYGNHQPIRIQKYLVLDQCNPYGWHEHQYKFVKKGTKLIIRKGSKLSNGTYAWRDIEEQATKDLEVNHYGDVLEDIYANTDRFYNTKDSRVPPRKVHIEEIRDGKIKDLIPPEEIMEQVIKDWDAFIRNMRFGEFRPNSKSALDYIRYLSTNPEDPESLGRLEFFKEENIRFTPDFKSARNPAFDRRLLVNTGILRYVGRKGYRDNYMDIKNNPKTDPFPAVSSLGMSMYLPALVTRDTEDISEINEFLKIFVRDTGAEVQSSKEAHRAMGALSAEQEKK